MRKELKLGESFHAINHARRNPNVKVKTACSDISLLKSPVQRLAKVVDFQKTCILLIGLNAGYWCLLVWIVWV